MPRNNSRKSIRKLYRSSLSIATAMSVGKIQASILDPSRGGIGRMLKQNNITFINTPNPMKSLAREKEGSYQYPGAQDLLILADSGGSNSVRSRVWKYDIQENLCDRYGLSVTVCHYPPGASKWNPADHRLHSEVSKNWAGKPLRTYETMLKLIRTTKTSTGLQVSAHFVRRHYKLGRKVTDEQMKSLSIKRHATFPAWNYTITPR